MGSVGGSQIGFNRRLGGPKTGVLSRTVFWVWGGVLGLGEVRDLYRKVGDIGGLHFHQVPSKSVPRGAKTSQKTVYLRIPSEQTTGANNMLFSAGEDRAKLGPPRPSRDLPRTDDAMMMMVMVMMMMMM